MDLPRFILLKSNANNKFLCYTKEKDSHPSLRFSYQANDSKASKNAQQEKKADDESVNIGFHHLKFEVEKAKTVEGLVHIRSCYNHKYWARKSEDSEYMAAVANEAEEDQSKWSCTLFKPVFLDDIDTSNDHEAPLVPLCKAYKIHLLHVSESGQLSVYVRPSEHLAASLSSSSDSTDDDHIAFTAFDVDATAILPEYVTFMGPNDKYATSPDINVYRFLEFTASDIGEGGVAQRIKPTDGLPQAKPIFDVRVPDAFWTLFISGNILVYDYPQIINPCLFAPVKVGNYVALKCMDNSCFVRCKENNTAIADATGITETAMLRVGEPVRIREINDATYDLADSRIYGTNSVEKFSDSRSNHTSVEQEGSFEVEYKTSQTKKWSDSTTVNIGVKVSWSAGIPYIGTLGVDISYEHEQTWETGVEQNEEKTIKYTQGIKIPPGKKVTLKVMAQKAYCDVPFTCKVRDLMTDGTLKEYTKTDGLYSGCNEFEFNTDLIPEDL